MADVYIFPFNVALNVCVCVCVHEREKKKGVRMKRDVLYGHVCVWVCVRKKKTDRKTGVVCV